MPHARSVVSGHHVGGITMTSWVVRIRCVEKQSLWVGNFHAEGREQAKRAARLFVSEHFPLDTKILAIARGEVSVHIEGDLIEFKE